MLRNNDLIASSVISYMNENCGVNGFISSHISKVCQYWDVFLHVYVAIPGCGNLPL